MTNLAIPADLEVPDRIEQQTLRTVLKESYEMHLARRMARDFFTNVRLAIFGLTGALLLFYYMISGEVGWPRILPWLGTELVMVFIVATIIFFFEDKFTDTRWQMTLMNLLITIAIAICGVGFYDLIPLIQDQATIIVSYTLIAGVLGAAAFTFTASKHTFLLFAFGWTFPMFVHLTIESESLAFKLLGGMLIIYIAVLYFLGYKDYQRRRTLILTELSLQDEKNLVIESSQKLQATLDVVNKLKLQQDGDYYLTALLLKPLMINTTRPRKVVVDFYIEQKKKFEFRQRKNAIGGDMCIAHNLTLRKNEYTVFINADAMGKSMQGAGGALVLGAVFQSIIERTRMRSDYAEMYPERWLKNAFIELQKVFESFDGSMLISLIMGLVDNETGLMYFINAEHPFAVLLRNGKASFVGESPYYRKLGTPGLDGSLIVNTYQLLPGDICILGSDGRDDLLMGHQNDQRIINEDEKLFLKHVEESQGDLIRMYELITNYGELTDDLSLMRIEFRAEQDNKPDRIPLEIVDKISRTRAALSAGNYEEAQRYLRTMREHEIRDARLLKGIVNLAFRCHDYETAAYFAEQYISLAPEDISYIYVASVAFKKHRNFTMAADLGERVRLRDPRNKKNLFNLAEIYYQLGNRSRATRFLEEILELTPDDKKAAELLSRLKKAEKVKDRHLG